MIKWQWDNQQHQPVSKPNQSFRPIWRIKRYLAPNLSFDSTIAQCDQSTERTSQRTATKPRLFESQDASSRHSSTQWAEAQSHSHQALSLRSPVPTRGSTCRAPPPPHLKLIMVTFAIHRERLLE